MPRANISIFSMEYIYHIENKEINRIIWGVLVVAAVD